MIVLFCFSFQNIRLAKARTSQSYFREAQTSPYKPYQFIPLAQFLPASPIFSHFFFFFSYGTYRPSVFGRTHRDAGEAKQVPRKNKSCPECYRSRTFYSALKEGEIVSQGERRNGDALKLPSSIPYRRLRLNCPEGHQ